MEGNSDTESSQILGDWSTSIPPLDAEEGIVLYSVSASSDSDEMMINDEGSKPQKEDSLLPAESTEKLEKAKDKAPISDCIAGGSNSVKENAAKRVLPSWVDPSYEWGGGKWKVDGRTNRKNRNEEKKKKKKKKKKEKEAEEKREVIPFREIIKSILRNSGQLNEKEDDEYMSCVEALESMGINFPHYPKYPK